MNNDQKHENQDLNKEFDNCKRYDVRKTRHDNNVNFLNFIRIMNYTSFNIYNIPCNDRCRSTENTIRFTSMNIQSLGSKLQCKENRDSLFKFNDIVMLCETWHDKSTPPAKFKVKKFKEINRHRRYRHANARRNSGGMLIYVRKKLLQNINIEKCICDHFVVMECTNLLGFNSYIIFSYMPPQDTTYICKGCDNDYVETLKDLVANFSSKGTVGVCGDLNARTGTLSDIPDISLNSDPQCISNDLSFPIWTNESNLSPRSSNDAKTNNYGKELLLLCHSSGLRIVNGRCFQDENVGKFTCYKDNGQSVVDYLLAQELLFNALVFFEIGEKWPDSDHCPVTFHLNAPSIVSPKFQSKGFMHDTSEYSKFIWDVDSSETVREHLFDEEGIEKLNEFYNCIYNLECGENAANAFSEFITQACDRSLRKSGKQASSHFRHNPWFDTECKDIKSQYHLAYKADELSNVTKCLGKQYKRVTQRKKRAYQREQVKDIQKCENPQQLWKKLKSLRQTAEVDADLDISDFFAHFSKPAIDNSDNKFDFDSIHEQELSDFFKQYINGNDLGCEENLAVLEILDANISADEIQNALKSLKAKKSPGLDGIPIDLFKTLQKELTPFLCTLFNYLLELRHFPDSWATAIISPVPKVPSPDTADQFRKISVLPAIGKIFEFIINNRFEFIDTAFQRADEFNGGFKKGSMTADNLFILNGIIEKYRILKKPLYVCFVDFKRAFDCIHRVIMFAKLIKDGFSGKILDVLISMYFKTSSSVKWKGMLSGFFPETMGVAQGGLTSPYLFKSFLKDLGSHLNSDCGVLMYQKIITHLLWADDLFIVSTSHSDMQSQLNCLQTYCSKWQLVVNTMKTKILVFGKKLRKSDSFIFNDKPIDISESYNYLGNPLCSSPNPFKNITSHITQKCIKACYKITEYCDPLGQITPTLAIHFYNTLISPLMDYCSEIWYRDSICNKLEKFSLKYFKRALHVRPTTSTDAIYGDLGIISLKHRLQSNVLKYLHRVINLPDDSPIKWVYNELCYLDGLGFDTWVSRSNALFKEYQSNLHCNLGAFAKLSHVVAKSKLKKASRDAFESLWSKNISECKKKLRTYKLFKSKIEFEPYLHVINPKTRTAIAKFRMSVHNLAIETGRHHRPKPLPVTDRICVNCETVEDEIHHLLHCTKFDDIRSALIDICILKIPHFLKLSTHDKFVTIMQSRDLQLINEIGTFLTKADSRQDSNTV